MMKAKTTKKVYRMNVTKARRATVEKVSAQPKEAFEKINGATAESSDLIKYTYSTALNGARDYNAKVSEFAQTNTEAVFGFVQKLAGVKSPSDFIELVTHYSRKQFETLTVQIKDLGAMAQKVRLASIGAY